jgi:hypothetical protein
MATRRGARVGTAYIIAVPQSRRHGVAPHCSHAALMHPFHLIMPLLPLAATWFFDERRPRHGQASLMMDMASMSERKLLLSHIPFVKSAIINTSYHPETMHVGPPPAPSTSLSTTSLDQMLTRLSTSMLRRCSHANHPVHSAKFVIDSTLALSSRSIGAAMMRSGRI